MLMTAAGRAILHGHDRATATRRISSLNGRSIASVHSQHAGRSPPHVRTRLHRRQRASRCYQPLECWLLGNSPGSWTAGRSGKNPGWTLGRQDRSGPAIGTPSVYAAAARATGWTRTPTDSRRISGIPGRRTRERSDRHWRCSLRRTVGADSLAGLSTNPNPAIPRTIRRPFWLTNHPLTRCLPSALRARKGENT